MGRLTEWLARHPLWTALAVLAVSAGALLLVVDVHTWQPRLEIDASLDKLLPATNEDRAVYDRSREYFGDAEAVIVAVTLDPVFTAGNLAKIKALTDRFRDLPGVDHVFSLATAPNLLASGDNVDVHTFTQQAAENPAGIPQL